MYNTTIVRKKNGRNVKLDQNYKFYLANVKRFTLTDWMTEQVYSERVHLRQRIELSPGDLVVVIHSLNPGDFEVVPDSFNVRTSR